MCCSAGPAGSSTEIPSSTAAAAPAGSDGSVGSVGSKTSLADMRKCAYVAEYDFAAEVQHGVLVQTPIPRKGVSLTTGSILSYCRQRMDDIVAKSGGRGLAIFKIGIATKLIPGAILRSSV